MSSADEVARIAAGRRKGKLKQIEIGLRKRSEHPSQYMIISSDGTVFWPGETEEALSCEVMLEPLQSAEVHQWTAVEVLDAIDRKRAQRISKATTQRIGGS
jgi:hypothetical protein